MDLATLIKHPERLDKDTLYDLRSYLALHPCVQPARLLLLQNLYLLHDSTFDEELRGRPSTSPTAARYSISSRRRTISSGIPRRSPRRRHLKATAPSRLLTIFLIPF